MRSAERISRTPSEWAERQRAERRGHLRALLAMLRRARAEDAEWYVWIVSGRPRYTTEQYQAVEAARRKR